jgi:hypothetical protein
VADGPLLVAAAMTMEFEVVRYAPWLFLFFIAMLLILNIAGVGGWRSESPHKEKDRSDS